MRDKPQAAIYIGNYNINCRQKDYNTTIKIEIILLIRARHFHKLENREQSVLFKKSSYNKRNIAVN